MAFAGLRSVYQTAMKALLVLLIAVLLTVMGLQIVMRYSFNASLIWAEEVCRYLLIWVSLIAGVFAYERGELAAMTLLRDSLPRRPALALAILANLVSALLCLMLVRYGLRFADMVGSQPIPAFRFLFEDTFGWGPGTVPRVYWVYMALPIGMGLLAIRLLVDVAHYAVLWARGGSIDDLRPLAPEGLSE
ncbi:TRAP transporter small permease [Amorphus coralli]|uniref:TRAP transporter small permease n=1 Tax=Amorphus coralli TaxID=340680 RepID=UPI0003635525|nr:TRAP transporter small permease subunit [Amorphus coralli]